MTKRIQGCMWIVASSLVSLLTVSTSAIALEPTPEVRCCTNLEQGKPLQDFCPPAYKLDCGNILGLWHKAVQETKSQYDEAVKNTAERTHLTKEQAIVTAEQFVRDQGYTDEPFRLPKNQIAYESLELFPEDEILERRRGTLNPRAVGSKKLESGGWIVGFHHAGTSERGRAVKMDAYGKNASVMHEDVDLSTFEETQ